MSSMGQPTWVRKSVEMPEQKTRSSNKRALMYVLPSYSMDKKYLSRGSIVHSLISERIPTSPFGCLFSPPPIQTQLGGQLGTFLPNISGWLRSSTFVTLPTDRVLILAGGHISRMASFCQTVLQRTRMTRFIS